MFSFYWEVVKGVPLLIWKSFAGVEGWIAVVAFIAMYFNPELGRRVASWDGFDRKWAIVPVVLYLGYLALEANYMKFVDQQAIMDAAVADLRAEIDSVNTRVEVYRVETEKLAIQNAELMRGAPVLTGKAAQVAVIREELLRFAGTAPPREGFTKEAGDAWLAAANTLVGFEVNNKRSSGRDFFVHNAWDGSYQDFQRCVASLRTIALDLRESDLPD